MGRFNEALRREADDVKPLLGPETWDGKKIGEALHFVFTLANTYPEHWRSKQELYEAMAKFRDE